MVRAEITSVTDTPDVAVELASAHRTSPYRNVAGNVAEKDARIQRSGYEATVPEVPVSDTERATQNDPMIAGSGRARSAPRRCLVVGG